MSSIRCVGRLEVNWWLMDELEEDCAELSRRIRFSVRDKTMRVAGTAVVDANEVE